MRERESVAKERARERREKERGQSNDSRRGREGAYNSGIYISQLGSRRRRILRVCWREVEKGGREGRSREGVEVEKKGAVADLWASFESDRAFSFLDAERKK